jgi:hypothetical protein
LSSNSIAFRKQIFAILLFLASFTLKNLPSQITRFANGTLEKKIGTRKSRNKNFMKLNPAQYAIDSEEYSCGLAVLC